MAENHTDPRRLIANFYDSSDGRGPRGTLRVHNLGEPDVKQYGESQWFLGSNQYTI